MGAAYVGLLDGAQQATNTECAGPLAGAASDMSALPVLDILVLEVSSESIGLETAGGVMTELIK